MTPWWVTLVGTGLTGVLAWAAQAWAKRGDAAHTLTGTAMNLVDSVVERVERLEAIDDWRAAVKVIDSDHIDVLEAHIWRQDPPPPPSRPGYPVRPH